jgi:anti-anti-sigma factor
VDSIDGGLILYLTGYIETYNSNFFQNRVNRAIESGFIRLIFHCSGLNYVSSTGIGSFTAFLKAVKPRGGDLVLLEIQPKVYEVFQLLGFSSFLILRTIWMKR